jgi:SAM-dependent methyltransferase
VKNKNKNNIQLREILRELLSSSNSDTKFFSKVYKKRFWGEGSGIGSTASFNKEFISFLRKWLIQNNINSIVDIGCGVWDFSHYVYRGLKVLYIGIDCAPYVIYLNKKRYGAPDRMFIYRDVIKEFDKLPHGAL